jgi:hypothetical protein
MRYLADKKSVLSPAFVIKPERNRYGEEKRNAGIFPDTKENAGA